MNDNSSNGNEKVQDIPLVEELLIPPSAQVYYGLAKGSTEDKEYTVLVGEWIDVVT